MLNGHGCLTPLDSSTTDCHGLVKFDQKTFCLAAPPPGIETHIVTLYTARRSSGSGFCPGFGHFGPHMGHTMPENGNLPYLGPHTTPLGAFAPSVALHLYVNPLWCGPSHIFGGGGGGVKKGEPKHCNSNHLGNTFTCLNLC